VIELPGRRRQRWAERENRRRTADYRRQHERWRRMAAMLERWLAAAREFTGFDADDLPPPGLPPGRCERVYGRFSGVALIEAQWPAGGYQARTGDFSAIAVAEPAAGEPGRSPPPVPAAQRLVGFGELTITDSRVVFHSASRDRQWDFSALAGIEYLAGERLILLHAPNQPVVSGFAVHAEQVASLRFLLTLALAHFRGEVTGLVAALESAQSRHAAAEPVRPMPARPEHAPGAVAAHPPSRPPSRPPAVSRRWW
jgi:hypothetical protein